MKTICKYLLLPITIFLLHYNILASHLIVGEMTYRHTGNNMYEFTVYYYRDCRPPAQGGGQPSALQSDDPLLISIYDGPTFYSFDSVYYSNSYTLPLINPNACENTNNTSCVNVLKFKFTKYLPPSINEYTILNQRCCMSAGIMNIANPDSKGYSFYCKVPRTIQNNSAVFEPVQNVRYCTGKKYFIDHSATDTDGDSLSYGFMLPESGGDLNHPKPVNYGGTLPTIPTMNYLSPYSIYNPIPGMNINEQTGIISLNSTIQGSFIANIYCHEWRNGIIINTIRRTYIYTISNCNFEVTAKMACDSNLSDASSGNICLANCENNTISFKNKSTGAVSYHWDFGVANLQDDTSNVFEPVYSYPDTGRYKVTLIAYGNNCTDSIIQYVNIFQDAVNVDFDFSGKLCTGSLIQFNSLANSATDSITYWKWQFINPAITFYRTDENPLMQFYNKGNYAITFYAYNSYGCGTLMEKEISLGTINLKAYQDTAVIAQTEVKLYATGADNYVWYALNNHEAKLGFIPIA